MTVKFLSFWRCRRSLASCKENKLNYNVCLTDQGKHKIDLEAYQREESQLDPALVDWELSQIFLSASFLQVLGPCHPKTGTVWEDLLHWNFVQYTLLGLSIAPLHLRSATWSYLGQCLCLFIYTSVWPCMYPCHLWAVEATITHNFLVIWCQWRSRMM